jgi:hypothetical protein
MGKPLILRWDEFMKPEYKSALISIHRETFNFLKHADKDYDQKLYVGEIAHSNSRSAAFAPSVVRLRLRRNEYRPQRR